MNLPQGVFTQQQHGGDGLRQVSVGTTLSNYILPARVTCCPVSLVHVPPYFDAIASKMSSQKIVLPIWSIILILLFYNCGLVCNIYIYDLLCVFFSADLGSVFAVPVKIQNSNLSKQDSDCNIV